MTDLLKLAERVEALKAPDREVDLEIHLALNPDGDVARVIQHSTRGFDGSPRTWELRGGAVLYEHRNDRGDCYSNGGFLVPDYTASIDSAITLVPKGWRLNGLSEHIAPLPHAKAALIF